MGSKTEIRRRRALTPPPFETFISRRSRVSERAPTRRRSGCVGARPRPGRPPDRIDEHLVSNAESEIVVVYVHPAVAREGVGSALLDALEERARDRRFGTLGLWAPLPALPFYLTHGYERVTEHTHKFAPGVDARVVELRTSL